MRTNQRWLKEVTVGGRMARWFFRLAAAALLVCAGLTWTPAMAQTGGDGAIQGTVKDSSGAIIPGATVTARVTAVTTPASPALSSVLLRARFMISSRSRSACCCHR